MLHFYMKTIIKISYDPECNRYVATGKGEAIGIIVETDTLEEALEDCLDIAKIRKEIEE